MNRHRLLSVTLLGGFLTACSPELIDEPASDELLELSEAVTVGADAWGFFAVRHDPRKCMWPTCGGYWIRRLNHSATQCMDSTYRSECYVAGLENQTGLSEKEWNEFLGTPNLVRGAVALRLVNEHRVAMLSVTEAWRASDGVEPAGTFFRAHDLGIRCLMAPCNSIVEEVLNSQSTYRVEGFLGRLGDAAGNAVWQGKTILFAGRNVQTSMAKYAQVQQFYVRQERPRPMCAEFTTSDGRFYAKNFPAGARADAEAWVKMDSAVTSSNISVEIGRAHV
jgi:hypothetical protein